MLVGKLNSAAKIEENLKSTVTNEFSEMFSCGVTNQSLLKDFISHKYQCQISAKPLGVNIFLCEPLPPKVVTAGRFVLPRLPKWATADRFVALCVIALNYYYTKLRKVAQSDTKF